MHALLDFDGRRLADYDGTPIPRGEALFDYFRLED
jgi:hypothetical protein